ncbi:CocE/NonD family hydrolase, partial [Cribrihabitans sp. XS_ASV171]
VYAVGGYADGYTNPVFRMMENLPGPRKALVGPWAHKYPHFATPAPRIGFLQEALRWWDQHLKGIDTGIMEEPMIRAWMQDPAAPGAVVAERPGHWISTPGWPAPDTESKTLHVTETGLADAPGAAPIRLACPETAGIAAQNWYQYGPGPDGPLDQNHEAGRMRFFETAPLEEDMRIFGFPRLRCEVASTVEQANLAAVLSMVAPDGRATLISFGVLNLTHRDGHAEPRPMPAGQPVPVEVQLNVIGQTVPAGHRLRLQLSQAYWPLIWPSAEKAELTLTAARLDLPLHPEGAQPELPEFGPAEGAQPLEAEVIEEGHEERTHSIDYATGTETHLRHADTGRVRHTHTGIEVHYETEDRFTIHPDDPNSATGTSRWAKHYRRGDWVAKLDVSVTVRALREAWHITATLRAQDAEGEMFSRDWDETIPRDLV